MKKHQITAEHLTFEMIHAIISQGIQLELSADAKFRIEKCRNYLDQKMNDIEKPIYGVTTGFGSLCNITISVKDLGQLQQNLVMSHACGLGDEVPREIVKLMLLLKIQALSLGHSGVQLQTVERLLRVQAH